MRNDQNAELEKIFTSFMKNAIPEWSKTTSNAISTSQYIVLTILVEEGSKKVTDLAKELNITLSAVTSLSDKLIDMGLAKRERNKTDRRVVELYVTESGKTLVKKINKKRSEKIEMFHSNLSEEEVSLLIKLYQKMLSNISTKGE